MKTIILDLRDIYYTNVLMFFKILQERLLNKYIQSVKIC